MKIHWFAKWLAIPYGSQTVVIQGVLSELREGVVVQELQLSEEDLNLDSSNTNVNDTQYPPEIQSLLQTYADVFANNISYPPPRACTHSIPLIPGSRPVSIRPYIYAPALKTEIENQVHEMLKQGLIQPINTSFSSHVLLVKKKDKAYHFCVDYRHLNAITVKGQFLVPIIDVFLDELS
jgi:hypothetical protein